MPVRWPRRPAAVSEAAAAGAAPDFSCAAGQKRAAKPPNGEVSSLSVVCVCASGSVGGVWSCVVCRVVDPPPSWWSGAAPLRLVGSCSRFSLRRKNLCRRFFRVSARLPIWGLVRVPVGMSPPSSIPSFVMSHCLRRRHPGSRATCIRLWRVRTLLVDSARELGVRGALFSWFAAVACFSCLNERDRQFKKLKVGPLGTAAL